MGLSFLFDLYILGLRFFFFFLFFCSWYLTDAGSLNAFASFFFDPFFWFCQAWAEGVSVAVYISS